MKKIISLVLLVSAAVNFTACSSDGGAGFKNAEQIISIDIACATNPDATDLSTYIPLLSGDVIVQEEEDNTVISTYHDVDGNKKVCLVSGKAYLIRK